MPQPNNYMEKSMPKINTITIGMRTIDLHAFTGEVVEKGTSTHTQSTVNNNNQVTTYTSTSSSLFIRSKDGEERSIEVPDMTIGVRQGSTVSLIWGIKKGKDNGPYIAVYNHDTKEIHHIRKGNNDLACPYGYNMMIIIAVMFGVIGGAYFLGGDFSSLFYVIIGVGWVYWLYNKQQKLMKAVKEEASKLAA